jgi:hypothetical protein
MAFSIKFPEQERMRAGSTSAMSTGSIEADDNDNSFVQPALK